MKRDELKEYILGAFQKYFGVVDELSVFADSLLLEFNSKNYRLSDLSSEKRISLFFLVRSMKTFSAVVVLCREGFGQDVLPLLRSFLENLISLKYILADPRTASQKTVRFVDYKWVIFKRHLLEGEEGAGDVLKKFNEFKTRYHVTSDKALLTWSGKTVRDMAKAVDKNLLKEYDLNFRMCSRFSHPGIIGDKEYIDYDDNAMQFSFLPSSSGITLSLDAALGYLVDLLDIFDGLFDLGFKAKIDDFRRRSSFLASCQKGPEEVNPTKSASAGKKDLFVKFKS